VRVTGLAVVSESAQRAQETLAFLQNLDRKTVYLAEIYQRGPTSVRSAATARAVMATLTDHGFTEPIPNGVEIDGCHRREAWRVLPLDNGAGQ
jgi:hypothetical protein